MMNNNMCKLAKKKTEAAFPKPKASGKGAAKRVVDEHRELIKRTLDKEDECSEDKTKLFKTTTTQRRAAQSTALDKLEDDNTAIGLLDMIKELTCNAGEFRNKFVIMQLLNRTLH